MSKKRVLSISVKEKGKWTEEIIRNRFFSFSRYWTIGNKYDCDVIANIQGGKQRLLEKKGPDYNFTIPVGMEGDITLGSKTRSIEWFTQFGFLAKKKNYYILPIPKDSPCTFETGDITLVFDYKEIAPPEKKILKIDRSLKRSWVNKEDHFFLITLALFAAIHYSAMDYMNTLEIKKDNPLEILQKIPQRFAKLILQPPKKKVIKKTIIKPLPEEEPKKEAEKEIDTPMVEPEEPTPPPVEEESLIPEPEEDLPDIIEETTPTTEPEKIQPTVANKELIREKVKSRGLLGVIMAKGKKDLEMSVFKEIKYVVKKIDDEGPAIGEGDILANLSDRDLETVEEVSKKIVFSKPKAKRKRRTSEIIKEKKGFLIEEKKEEQTIESNLNRQRDEREVYKTIIKYIGGLKYLYNNALRKDPYLRGSITVKMTVSQEGVVSKVEKISSTLDSPPLEKAIIKRIFRWRFLPLKSGADFTINYTFDFSPVG